MISPHTSISPTTLNQCGPGIITFSSTLGSGFTWHSSAPTYATIDIATGICMPTGIAGTTIITYGTDTLILNLYDLPTVASVIGPTTLCVGQSFTYTCSTPGGVWSTDNPTNTSITSTGLVTALIAGGSTIKYTVTNSYGCSSNSQITITKYSLPDVGTLSGPTSVVLGSTITISSTVIGGVWSTSNTAIATIDSSTGIVTPILTGTCNIIYSITNSNGCTNYTSYPITVTNPGDGGSNTCCPIGQYYVNASGYYLDPRYGLVKISNTSTTSITFDECLNQCCSIPNAGWIPSGAPVSNIDGDPIACPCCPDNYTYNSTTGLCVNNTTGSTTSTILCIPCNCVVPDPTPCENCGNSGLPISFIYNPTITNCKDCNPSDGELPNNSKLVAFIPNLLASPIINFILKS